MSLSAKGQLVIHDKDLDVLDVISESAYSDRGAVLSEDETCRFALWRNWGGRPTRRCVFIGLNPSTADATQNDPTIRRCIDFAKRWDCTGLLMVNLFATRSTDPSGIRPDHERVANALYVRIACASAYNRVAAWGAHKTARSSLLCRQTFPGDWQLRCLGTNKDGSPKHPLYVPAVRELAPWNGYL